jgi:hypothetical protein
MRFRLILALWLVCSILPAQADESVIAYVKVLSGEAWLTLADKTQKLELGTPIHLGEQLNTGDNGEVGLTFKDETMLSLGPNTSVAINEYLYDPAKAELKLTAKMLKGALQYISGVIAKLRPEAVNIQTPSGYIGVRGTRFLVLVAE